MKLPLEVNDRVQAKVYASGSEVYFESRVEEVSAGELLISWPMNAEERMPVSEQQVLSLVFTRNHRVYEFEASVLDVISTPAPLVAIRPSGTLRSIQRRDDFRVRALAPVELAAKVVGIARYKDARTRLHRIKSETVTISGGGFNIHYSEPLPLGMVFEIKLSLPGENQTLQMSAKIVRCMPMGAPDAQPAVFDLGFVFTRVPESVRSCIVRFVFGAQREARLDE